MSQQISRRSLLGIGAAAGVAAAGAHLAWTATGAAGAAHTAHAKQSQKTDAQSSAQDAAGSSATSGVFGPGSPAIEDATTAQSSLGNSHLAINETGNAGYWNEDGKWIPGWLQPPAAPASADEELNCDVLVIGLGVAGLCAARAAVEEGADVICVEQSENYNCRAAQFGSINSEHAVGAGVEFSAEEKTGMLNAELQANGWRPDARIWRTWIDNSGAAFDWHISANPDIVWLDPNLTPSESGIDGAAVPTKGMNAESTDGKMYMTCFNNPKNPEYDYASELYPMYPDVICFRPDQVALNDKIMEIISSQARVHFSTRADLLITGADGSVTGAWCTTSEGKILKINAKAVVDSCGDYGSNTEMRSYFSHESFEMSAWVWSSMDSAGNPTNMGSGLKLAAWAGAAPDFSAAACMTHSFGGALGCDPFLLVDKNGGRFCNEDVPGHLWSQVTIRTPGKVCFQIFDSKYPEQVHSMPTGHACYWKITEDKESEPWGRYVEDIGFRTPEAVTEAATAVADTLDELAEQLGVDAEGLKATVERYNQLAEQGYDEDFGKRADRLYPIVEPPFYGSRIDGTFAFCMTHGVLADAACHALNAEREPVKGLYVAGNSMGCRFAEDYPTTIMGVSHGMAMTFGRLAGTNAAKGV